MMVECKKELGSWTVRVNGIFVADFPWWREGRARRLAMNLQIALKS